MLSFAVANWKLIPKCSTPKTLRKDHAPSSKNVTRFGKGNSILIPMMHEEIHTIPPKKKIALVAHDGRKKDLLDWVEFNLGTLRPHLLFATGTTGKKISEKTGLLIHRFKSGPLGG